MKKINIIIFLLLLFSISCYSEKICNDDRCISFTLLSNNYDENASSMIEFYGNEETKGWFYIRDVEIDTTLGDDPLYALFVEVENKKYYQEDKVRGYITIVNEGKKPDTDTELIIYLKSPSNKKYEIQKMIFKEVLPACPEGNYKIDENICMLDDGNKTKAQVTIIEKDLLLPPDSQMGNWEYYALYTNVYQGSIESFDTFFVSSGSKYLDFLFYIKYYMVLIIAIIIFVLFILLFLFILMIKKKKGD